MHSSILGQSFTSRLLEKGMNGHYARQEAIASNIANVETPGYGRRDVAFERTLERALGEHRVSVSEQMGASGGLPGQIAMKAEQFNHFISESETLEQSQNEAFEVTVDTNFADKNDKNSVDIEGEMVQLAKNGGRFKSLTVIQGRLNNMTRTLLQQAGQV